MFDSKSLCVWGTHRGSPASHAKSCEGKGKCQAIDGGLSCYDCWCARKKGGDSNPTRWTSKSYYEFKKGEDRRKCQDTTTTDYEDVKNFLHVPKSRFTDD